MESESDSFFSIFLNNRLSIGAALGFEEVLGSNYSKLDYTRNLLLFSPEATYFLNPKAKWKLYINGSYLLAYSQNKYKDKPKSNYNSISHGFDFNIGVNCFLNDNIAFSSSVFCNYNDLLTNGKKDYIFGYLGLNLSFQNFISQPLHQQYEEKLLHRKRKTIGGNANLSYRNIAFSFDYGYFPLKNLLIGINTYSDYYFGPLRNRNQQSRTKPYLQYYIPFTKKTAIFSNISIPITLNYDIYKRVSFIPSLGFNHFLSKYVAIEFYGKYKPYRITNPIFEEHKFSLETNIRYFLK